MRWFLTPLLAGVACLGSTPQPPLVAQAAAGSPGLVVANDNRVPAGSLRDGVLTVRLEAGAGTWHPDSARDAGLPVFAFGEPGRALQVPGPLLRVREGTELRVLLHNRLERQLVVHGLYTRGRRLAPGADTVLVAPGAEREVRFAAGTPGTYYYWATTDPTRPPLTRQRQDTQLSGAFVVDPRGGPATPPDRIFVIGFWTDSARAVIYDTSHALLRLALNGRSWPGTERLTYDLGETVRWRLVNPTALTHPMHLHGFYFQVLSRGGESADTTFPRDGHPELGVTEHMVPGATAMIQWVASRPGFWLFHCHDDLHVRPRAPLGQEGMATVAAPARPHNHAFEMMSGMVLSVLVRSSGPTAPPSAPRRHLRLEARVDSGGSALEPAYAFVLHDLDRGTNAGGPSLPGPPLVLRRGEPVSITVVNRLPEPTAVHWHGIELDSYYDGVPDFAGRPGHLAPDIAPGDSFEVRFTPPRAGTFIYHTHMDQMRQQRAGLAGALIVLPPGAAYDPTTDISIVIGTPRAQKDDQYVLVNGSISPAPIELSAGRHVRLRFIGVHTYKPNLVARILRDSTVETWQPIAKDGAPLPARLTRAGPAEVLVGTGETHDFDFAPAQPGHLRLELSRLGRVWATLPINVH